MPVSLSSDVLPQIKEFERSSTTVVNAYVKPPTRRYLAPGQRRGARGRLRRAAADHAVERRHRLGRDRGGVPGPANRVRDRSPVPIVARHFGALLGLPEVLSFDMGGTTAKACLIRDGQLPLTDELEVARSRRFTKSSGFPVATPAVNMIEIGAGGGSIAQVGALGIVQVGPESAGAAPGPACYGGGGTLPTVTDADLILGYLDPERFAGGSMRLDAAGAKRAVEQTLGAPLGLEAVAAAWTVHDVVNETMATAVRMHVTERGGDPSRPVLVAFGGAGPVHVANLAAKLGIRRVLVPLRAGVLSALGLLLSPAAFDLKRTRKQPLDRLDPAAVRSEIGQMKQAIAERLAEAAPGARPDWVVTLEVGYIGQGYQVPVPVSDQQLAALTPASLLAAFAEVYRAKYGYYYDDVPAELVNILVAGQAGDMPAIISALPESAGAATPRGARLAWSPRRRERIEFAIYDRNALAPGMSFPRPGDDRGSLRDDGRRLRCPCPHRPLRLDRNHPSGGAAMTGRLPLEIIWPRLIAAADEMATTLFRTAFSHDVIEVHDMSTGLYDDRGNLIAQTYLGATGHVGVMPVIGKNLVRRFPRETIRPGDVFISNDPWVCNGQTADIFIIMPAFHEDRLIGFSINSVHHVDIGGRKGSGLAEEVYEEGLIIPLMRLHEAGRPNEVLLSLIERNVRFSDKVMGDLRAQMAAGWVGATGLPRIAADHKLGDLRKVADWLSRKPSARSAPASPGCRTGPLPSPCRSRLAAPASRARSS